MIIPARQDLTARRNDNPFRARLRLRDENGIVDLTSFTGVCHIRLRPGASGSPLIAATVACSIDGMDITITKSQLASLPQPAEAGGDAEFSYDVLLTPSGGDQNVWVEGDFILKPGVTVVA